MSVLRAVAKTVLPARVTARITQLMRQRRWRQINASSPEFLELQLFMQRAFTAIAFNGISGDYAEFGCWSGRTFVLAHKEIERAGVPRHLWAFDSFKGLPPAQSADDWHPEWNEGALAMSLGDFLRVCRDNDVAESDFTVVAGFYDNTIGAEASYTGSLPTDIAFAFIDCDMHSSTTIVLEFLRKRLKHGMIVAFDDYYCASSATLAGERKALLEFLDSDARFHFLPYVQFGWHGMSFQLEKRALLRTISRPPTHVPPNSSD
jgi:O-methyltransferase